MKIVVVGNYGAQNLGDEMILEGLLVSLKAAAPSAEITVLSGNPTETSELHGVKSEPKVPAGIRSLLKPKGKTSQAIKKCDYLVLGGGGLFSSLSYRANLIWAVQAFAAIQEKKPIICYGQSVEEVKSPILKTIIRKIFNHAIFITVRDRESLTNLQNIGIKKEIHVVPDLAFRVPIIPSEKKSHTAMVALRQMSDLPTQFDSSIINFLKWLAEKENKKIEFINFQEGTESDAILHQKIQQKVPGNIVNQLQNFFQADFVLGMRLHSIITAIKAATPFIAISYSPKVKAFLRYAGLDEYMIELKDISFENLTTLYQQVQKEREQIIKKLKNFNREALEKHHQIEETLKSSVFRK